MRTGLPEVWMPGRRRQWSLKTWLGVLGTTAVLLLAFAGLVTLQLIRQTESAVIGEASHQLRTVAEQLVTRYHYVLASFAERRLPSPIQAHEEPLLTQLTEVALTGHAGVEGGFFASDGALLGYAFPTYSGTGKKTDVPVAERATILRVAREAFVTGRPVHQQVGAGQDVLLFWAEPIVEHGQRAGAVWLMRRLPGLRATYRTLWGWGLTALVLAGALVAGAAALILRRLSGGVDQIEAGLLRLEQDLSHEIPPQDGAELQRLADAINRLGRALQAQQAQQQRLETALRQVDRLAALGRLVVGVAHEVRNPLASIKLKVRLCEKVLAAPDTLRQHFAVIHAEIERLDRLVERLLLLAKPVPLEQIPTDLNRFLAGRLEIFRAVAEARGITLTLEPGALPGPVPIDPERLAQVVENLLANAVEAIPEGGGAITVSTQAVAGSPAQVRLMVADTGPGIPPEAVDRIFEPFYTTKDEGTGLGLYLAAELVRAHGGELSCTSGAGRGATFQVVLPC